MTMGWATTLMANDAEERAIVTASMNAIGQAITAWSQLLEFPAVQAPNFHKGFVVIACLSGLQFISIGAVWFLARKQTRKYAEVKLEIPGATASVAAV
jgi:ACS family pantothenate transporter-like MFS transporter